jgi:hypothetical protein
MKWDREKFVLSPGRLVSITPKSRAVPAPTHPCTFANLEMPVAEKLFPGTDLTAQSAMTRRYPASY